MYNIFSLLAKKNSFRSSATYANTLSPPLCVLEWN